MTDLEMLELLEKAKEKNTGPKGEPGVGIQSVEQFEDNSFTFRLTDGSFKKIQLPTPQDGAVGPAGVQGERGLPGPAGKSGRDGAPGNPGVDGLRGSDGSFVETALVNARGRLLIGLSDGEVIDAGAVVGPVGATGERGATGLPGQPGADGAAVLSGPRTPTQDDGVEGDHWIDISSAEFSFYKKSGNGWSRLASLRSPGRDPRVGPVGGGSAGSGGGGGGVDLPPVIINIDPPNNGNNGEPVRAGDLWFDSDQLALYVATKDASNDIVWVIAIPGVTGVPSTQTASVVVVYPKAVDGDEFVNPLTSVTYRYNEPKKQWINVNGGIVSVQGKPPATPQTGSLWFDTENDDLTLYIYTGSEWVSASPPVSLDGINTAIANVDAELMKVNANIAMNKRDIDEAMLDVQADQAKQDERLDALEAQDQDGGDFLPTAGGELKGTLEINGSRDNDGKINPLLCRADGYYMSFGVNKDGEVFAGSSVGQPFMAETGWHVVTKGYLDSHVPRHFGSPYVFRNNKKPADLETGEFTYDSDWNWYAHRYDAEGDRIGVSSDHTITTDGMFKVYKYNGAINLICIMHRYESCKCGQDENDYMKWVKKASIYTHVDWLDDGNTYYLSDGFLLPQ